MCRYEICFQNPGDIAEFVEIMNQYNFDIDLVSENKIVDAKSVIGVMAISKAGNLELVIHSDNPSPVLNQIRDFLRIAEAV